MRHGPVGLPLFGMNSSAGSPVVVVLAAGPGSRFRGEGHKLAQRLGDTTVLGATLSLVVSVGLPLVVVTTAALESLVQEVVAAKDIVLVPALDGLSTEPLGQGDSIAAGVNARAQAGGWLVLPGDMPLVHPNTLRAVLRAMHQAPIVMAQYRGRRRHPVGFSQELYMELCALTGEDGVRRLMSRYPAHEVDVEDAGLSFDIDTQATLHSAREYQLAAPRLPVLAMPPPLLP